MSNSTNCALDPKFQAGFRLMSKFQEQWTQLHANSERNALKSKDIMKRIHFIDRQLSERLRAQEELVESCRSLDKIQDQVDRLATDIDSLEDCVSKILGLLIVLRNRKESIEFERDLDNIESKFEACKLEQYAISQTRRLKLKSDHLDRVEKFEREQRKELDERMQILERAFEEEKTLYLKKSDS